MLSSSSQSIPQRHPHRRCNACRNGTFVRRERAADFHSHPLARRAADGNGGTAVGHGARVRAMINGEMLIVLIGLGALLRSYGNRFDVASVYGLLLVIITVALIATTTIQWVEHRVTRWTE